VVELHLVQRTGDAKSGEIMKKKIVLKNRQTNAYLGENNGWLESSACARLFETPYHALYFCVSKELEGIDIISLVPGQKEVRFLRC
jgi:hypothetical protein